MVEQMYFLRFSIIINGGDRSSYQNHEIITISIKPLPYQKSQCAHEGGLW